MTKLNEAVEHWRWRRRRRLIVAMIVSFLIGFVFGHILLHDKESHAQGVVPVVSAGAFTPLRLSPDRHEGPSPRASRARVVAPRARRAADGAHQSDGGARPAGSPFQRWRTSAAARAVVQCESGQDGSWAWHYGKYRGYWQMDPDFWRTYGGLRFASSPELASRTEQDTVAYAGYLARGWEPWTCARIVGLI